MLRGALFNICQQEIEGANFLDLFAGSGVMGIEALSRGAKFVTFVDNDREAVRCIKKNIEQTEEEKNSLVIQSDVLQALERFIRQGYQYDIIYIDPPYEDKYTQLILEKLDEASLLKPGGLLFLEEAHKAKIHPEKLVKLTLIDTRAFGRSTLFRFQ